MSADESPEKSNVAVIGLGSMGFGMASSLVRRGHAVIGYDPSATAAEKLAATGARIAKSPGDAAANASVVLCVVVPMVCSVCEPRGTRPVTRIGPDPASRPSGPNEKTTGLDSC